MTVADFPRRAKAWLGCLPSDWSVAPLKYVVDVNPETLSENTDPEWRMEYADISSVSLGRGIMRTQEISFEHAPSRAKRKVRSGDTLVSTVRTYLRAITLVHEPPENLIASTGFAVLRPKPVLHPNFLGYFATSDCFVSAVVADSVGVSYPATNALDIIRFPISFPGIRLQQKIVDFLDRRTLEIDALIAKKRRLLDLLAEKRSTLITRAVTKGINPETPMKASGVEWLGEIPAHWHECQLRRTWRTCDYGLSDSIRNDYGVPVLRMSCIADGRIDVTQAGLTENVKEDLLLEKDDLLFNRTNSLDQIAKIGRIDFEPDYAISFASYLVRIRVNELVSPEYLVYLLNSSQFLRFARACAIPAIGQANLNPSRYGSIRIPLPPLDEQNEIVEAIEKEKAATLPLEDKITHSIAVLKEERSTLITSAVTGQIRVA